MQVGGQGTGELVKGKVKIREKASKARKEREGEGTEDRPGSEKNIDKFMTGESTFRNVSLLKTMHPLKEFIPKSCSSEHICEHQGAVKCQ